MLSSRKSAGTAAALATICAGLAVGPAEAADLFVAGTIGEVYKGDSATGTFTQWGGIRLGPIEALAMDDQHVYAGDQAGAVIRFDRETGNFLGGWFAPDPITAMVTHDGDLLVAEYYGTIRRLDPIDGTIEATLRSYGPLTAMHLIDDDLYVTGIEGSVWRGNAVTGGFEYFGCQCSSEVQGIANDEFVLYVVDAFGLLQRYALADGALLNETFLPLQATAMVSDGSDLLISDDAMNVHRVSADTGAILDTLTSPIAISAMQMAEPSPPRTKWMKTIRSRSIP